MTKTINPLHFRRDNDRDGVNRSSASCGTTDVWPVFRRISCFARSGPFAIGRGPIEQRRLRPFPLSDRRPRNPALQTRLTAFPSVT